MLKEFMLGLSENEIERNLTQRAVEASENTEDYDEQGAAVSDDSAGESEEYNELYEPKDVGMSMGM